MCKARVAVTKRGAIDLVYNMYTAVSNPDRSKGNTASLDQGIPTPTENPEWLRNETGPATDATPGDIVNT